MPSDDESGAISDDGLSPIRGNSGAVSLCSVRDGGVSHLTQLSEPLVSVNNAVLHCVC